MQKPEAFDALLCPNLYGGILSDHAVAVDTALRSVLAEGKYLTPDLGGRASTTEFTEQILVRL